MEREYIIAFVRKCLFQKWSFIFDIKKYIKYLHSLKEKARGTNKQLTAAQILGRCSLVSDAKASDKQETTRRIRGASLRENIEEGARESQNSQVPIYRYSYYWDSKTVMMDRKVGTVV